MSRDTASNMNVDVDGQEWGSDYVADLLQAYDFDYVSFNPGASFRGLEESIVNYNENDPEVIETAHEGLSVSIAHGYAKAKDEPALCVLHDVVGTMHGSMGVFNAYCDRVPILILSGTGPMRKSDRRPWIEWIHTALVQGDLLREYVKWDDQPMHIDGVDESIIRAYDVADTPPKGPTYVTLDHDVQECALDEPMALPDLKAYPPTTRMAPEPEAIEEAAEMLIQADFPLILPGRYGTSPEAVDTLRYLAELIGAAVVDPHKLRNNFPNTHDLNVTDVDLYDRADLILSLDVMSLDYYLAPSFGTPDIDFRETKVIDIGTQDLEISSLIADYCRIHESELNILSDTQIALENILSIIEESDFPNETVDERYETIKQIHSEEQREWEEMVTEHWDDDPISVSRLCAEIWEVIQEEEWVLVNGTLRDWTHRIWEIDEFDKYIGGKSGGGGVGYGIGAAIGGALAYSDSDRIPINLQPDGDLMFYLSGLWTIGHYELPMFTVVHNNGSYYNSTNHRMELAEYRGRDSSYERALIGTGLWGPTPDYAQIAESMGVNGYGPIEDPEDLGPALRSAWEDVMSGEPALVDVISQPR